MANDRHTVRAGALTPRADGDLQAVRISPELQQRLDRIEQIEAECDELVRTMRPPSDRPDQSVATRARARN